MVTGNAAVIPTTILEPLRTIPATIAAELGEAPAVVRTIRHCSCWCRTVLHNIDYQL